MILGLIGLGSRASQAEQADPGVDRSPSGSLGAEAAPPTSRLQGERDARPHVQRAPAQQALRQPCLFLPDVGVYLVALLRSLHHDLLGRAMSSRLPGHRPCRDTLSHGPATRCRAGVAACRLN